MAYKRKEAGSYPLVKCVICLKETRARHPSKVYCSNACRQEAARRRKGTSKQIASDAKGATTGGVGPGELGNP